MEPFLVVDIEATCWPGEFDLEISEIIEIGAVLVDHGQIVAGFQRCIRPARNPVLSEFCKELTGIAQHQVDQAASFPQVMASFGAWFTRWPDLEAWGSWGNYDLRHIEQQCRQFQIDNPLGRLVHHNLKAEFARTRKIKQCGMVAALRIAGLELQGRHHSALDDARNIARLVCLESGREIQ